MSSKLPAATGAAIAAIIISILFPLPVAVAGNHPAIAGDSESDRFAGQPRVHLAGDTFTLQAEEERIVNLTATNSFEPLYIIGNATVQGGGMWIRLTDSHNQCPGGDGCTSVAVYSKDAPWSYYDGNIKNIEIPIPKGMQHVVFYTPYSQGSTMTFNFDIVRLAKSNSSSS